MWLPEATQMPEVWAAIGDDSMLLKDNCKLMWDTMQIFGTFVENMYVNGDYYNKRNNFLKIFILLLLNNFLMHIA